MNITALSSNAAFIALAAISSAGSADAGPLLCEDVHLHASAQSSCLHGDSYYAKNQRRIDYLFDAGTPAAMSVLSEDWSSFEINFNSGKKLDERLLQLWHPLGSWGGLNIGRAFDEGGKWTQPQLHGGQPTPSVPEPRSLFLLGIGLVGAALSRRVKRSQRLVAERPRQTKAGSGYDYVLMEPSDLVHTSSQWNGVYCCPSRGNVK